MLIGFVGGLIFTIAGVSLIFFKDFYGKWVITGLFLPIGLILLISSVMIKRREGQI